MNFLWVKKSYEKNEKTRYTLKRNMLNVILYNYSYTYDEKSQRILRLYRNVNLPQLISNKIIHEMMAVPKRNLLSGQNITRSMTTLGLPINRHGS